jgi:hypothetical protein
MVKLIPQPNHTPTASADYNWVLPLINTNNGYMFHAKVDYNLNDRNKLYVSYNQQHELYGSPVMRWWIPGNAIETPGDPSSADASRTISGSYVKVFNSTTTNEFLAGLSYLNAPITFGNEKAIDRQALGYPYVAPDSSAKIMPNIMNSWWTNDMGIPMLLDNGRGSYFARKMYPSISDNFTKILKTHTFKAGISWIRGGDRGSNVGQTDGPTGTAQYGPVWDYNAPDGSQITSAYNPVLDFLLDLPSGYSSLPVTISDLKGDEWGFYGQDEWKATRRLMVNFGVRLVHDTPFEDATGKYGASAWTQAWYDADLANGITALPGMRWHAKDPSIPLAGRTVNALFFAPRFGIAYDFFGDGKTFFRGGFGSYYYSDGVGGSSGLSIAQGGTSCSLTSATFLSQVDAGKNVSCASSQNGLTSGTAVDPHDHVEPRTLTYNFTVSQQTFGNSLFELTYSGSQSSDLINPLQNINIIPIGAFAKPNPNPASSSYGQLIPITTISKGGTILQDYSPLTHYTSMNLIRHGAWSNYNGLQASWTRRQGSLTYNLNYTWSKTLGITGGSNISDPVNMHNDYGPLGQDRTHVFNASYAYEVGHRFKNNKLEAAALNGWMISGISSVQSGAPLQQSYSGNLNLGGKNSIPDPTNAGFNSVNSTYYLGTNSYKLQPKLNCNPAAGLKGGEYINPSCFGLPAPPQFNSDGVLTALGGQGSYQMPYLRGPIYLTNDLSLSRSIKIAERQSAEVKFTGMNFLNHALTSFDQNNANNINLNFSDSVLATSGTGWVYGVPNEKFGRRVLEMSLRYNF